MNNHRLLAGGLLTAVFTLGGALCGYAQTSKVMSLEEIFTTAETNSTRIRKALSAENVAAKDINVARSQRLPEIDVNLSVSYIGDGFITDRNYSNYQKAPIPHLGTGLGINISQPVYAGGAITTGIELAELKSTASRLTTELNRDGIRLQLTGYYLDLYKYSNLRSVVESNIAQAEKVLADMQVRFEQGTALQNDITRYELLVSNLKLELIKINNVLDILNRNLVVTAGLPADIRVEPDSSILDRSLARHDKAWWQAEAADNSASLALARNGLEMSRKSENLAKADRRPKIGLQAGWTMDGPILVEVPPLNYNLSYWWVGVGVSFNLSSLYKSNKKLARSRAATVEAEDNLALARETLDLDVNTDYIHYLESYEELRTREKSLELAERNYNIVFTRYSADMALITDMLDAANSKLDAEQQLVNARINIIYYYYKLHFTSGTI